MKPGAPWSVKGIEPQARETAKSAARRAGMTLGEWLNQVILETGVDTPPVADPMRAPEDWMLETGSALPWIKPIEEMSAEVTARLAASEAGNTALLGSIEAAIGSISRRLVELDKRGPSPQGSALEDRLSRIETVQRRALSKDHLKTLETAVSQISVVFDSQTKKQNEITSDLGERIDQSRGALDELSAQLEQTEDRVSQALCAVEAAAELYDITDKQGQIIDSLVMDVAAVHAEQQKIDARSSTGLASIADELGSLKTQVQSFEDKLAATGTATPSDPAEDVKLATTAISRQISANEEKTAESVALIEERIVGLSQILDQSLQIHHSGIEDLHASLDSVLKRIETLENQGAEQEPASPVRETPGAPQPDPITFKTLTQQPARSVNVNMAVTIDPDFTRTQPAAEVQSGREKSEETVLTDDTTAAERATGDEGFKVTVEPAAPLADIDLAPQNEDRQPSDMPEPAEMKEIVLEDTSGEPSATPEIELVADAEPGMEGDAVISGHFRDVDALEDEPLTFADIFGSDEATPLDEATASETTKAAIDPEADAALREAVTNISTIRASWAAKSDAESRTGSMRQIVDVDSDDTSKRGWALVASGMTVGLIAISSVLIYSGDSADLVDADERPGLFDQMTAWIPGRSSRSPGANTPTPADEPEAILTTHYGVMPPFPAGLEQAALAGDAKARFALGRALVNGDGRPVDREAARNWYEAAAEQGLAIAQYVLGSLHERGIDVEQDKKAAIDWYASAARGGNRRAMHNLGVAYARGDVIPQDLARSAYWFSEAAELGLTDSQYNLALLHERGLGTEKDLVTAWKWYSLAAAGGDTSAAAQVEELGQKLTDSQKKTAQSAIDAWQPREMEPVANGLFDISPTAYDNGQQRRDLATVQSRLMTMGYALAGTDGIMDPSTRKAIRTFQASNSLEVTGAVTPGLIEILTENETIKNPAN